MAKFKGTFKSLDRAVMPGSWLFAKGSRRDAKDATAQLTEISLAAEVQITAGAEASGEQPAKRPTFRISAYDGSVMKLPGIGIPVVIDLKGLKAARTIKAFRDHDPSRIVGHITKHEISSSGVEVEGVMSATGSEPDEIVAASANGFPWEASVGVDPIRKEFLATGKTTRVNGREVVGPALIARSSTLKEVSFVAIGAAESTEVSIAAGKSRKDSTMKFEAWLKANGFDPANLSAQQKKALKAAWQAEIAAAADAGEPGNDPEDNPADDVDDINASGAEDPNDDPDAGDDEPIEASRTRTRGRNAQRSNNNQQILADIRAEHARAHRINAFAEEYGNPTMKVKNKTVSIAAHAIEQGWDLDKTELAMIRASRPSGAVGGLPSVQTSTGSAQLTAAAIECALCASSGFNSEFLEEHFDERALEASQSRGMRGMGLQQFFHMVLAANGVSVMPGQRVDGELIKAAYRAELSASGGGFSTISLSGILSNLANKAMLQRFEAISSVVPEIAFETDTNDFKPYTRYRLDGKGNLNEVGADGELKHIELTESSYSNQLKTQGGMIALTRQMIRNDDLGAFLQIPMIFGELALHAREQIVFTLLLANAGSFFGTGNGNYQEGAATALSIDSLSTAIELFRTMKNKGGKFVMINPDRLLLPPALEALGKQIFTSTMLAGTTTADKLKPVNNPHSGMFRPVVSPYLSEASGLSGASNKAWYLLSSPAAGRAPIQVGYLAGQRTPVVESAETDFNTLGMQWRTYWDFGAALFEPLSGVKSKGEA